MQWNAWNAVLHTFCMKFYLLEPRNVFEGINCGFVVSILSFSSLKQFNCLKLFYLATQSGTEIYFNPAQRIPTISLRIAIIEMIAILYDDYQTWHKAFLPKPQTDSYLWCLSQKLPPVFWENDDNMTNRNQTAVLIKVGRLNRGLRTWYDDTIDPLIRKSFRERGGISVKRLPHEDSVVE